MPISDHYDSVDPTLIIVNRDDRQRRIITTDDLEPSIQRNGVLHPIVVTREMVLVAGERRLTACLNLGVLVPIRFFDTLSKREVEIIQLEENVKRKNLPWQDEVTSMGRIHELFQADDPAWSQEQTAKELGVSQQTISNALSVYAVINPKSPDYKSDLLLCAKMTEVLTKIQRQNNKEGEQIISELLAPSSEPTIATVIIKDGNPQPSIAPQPESVIQGNFLEWAGRYTGKPFSLIHCDFPYGGRVFDGRQMSDYSDTYDDDPKVYWDLLKCLCDHRDQLLFHHGFVVLWFSMIHYIETLRFLHQNAPDLAVERRPLVWLKSDNAGVCPDPRRKFRQIYETALVCRRNDTKLIATVANAYACPTQRKLHASAKPEPMLTHFMRALVDKQTRLLDPTCGSGTALCAADVIGAEFVFGIDIDKEHVETARAKLRQQRVLNEASKLQEAK